MFTKWGEISSKETGKMTFELVHLVTDGFQWKINLLIKRQTAKEIQDVVQSAPQSNKKRGDSKAIKAEYSLAF